jgi:hypothetical protein
VWRIYRGDLQDTAQPTSTKENVGAWERERFQANIVRLVFVVPSQ